MPPAMSRLAPALLVAAVLVGFAPADVLAADWSKAQKITVVTVEYAFKPADLRFRSGQPYRLHLENKGKEAHEFTAPDFFKTLDMRNPDMTGPDRQEIVLQPGRKKDFYFVAEQAGSFDLRCSDHDWAGMVGHITVTK
jgi:uncharacterized cupredoxin-like copper-binding protein